jgi:hypothetical protein
VADALHTPPPVEGQPGVVSAQDGRLDDAGLIALHGAGMDVRTGVMYGPGTTALITGTADTAPMAVLVAAHHAVTRRQVSEGVYRGATEAPVRVSIDAAPASDSRIDVVWVKQADASAGVLNPDGTTEWLVSKTTGTVAVSPTKPAIPTGAEELGTVTVAAGATSTDGAGVTISNTARQTVARGARIPVRSQAERDALTRFAGLEVYRLDNGMVQLCPSASGTDWLTLYDPAAPVLKRETRQWKAGRGGNASDNFASGSMVQLFATVIVAAPAGEYTVNCRLVISNSAASSGFQRLTANGTIIGPSDARADTWSAGNRFVFPQTGSFRHGGGDLTLAVHYQASTGTATVWSQGTEIVTSYHGPS